MGSLGMGSLGSNNVIIFAFDTSGKRKIFIVSFSPHPVCAEICNIHFHPQESCEWNLNGECSSERVWVKDGFFTESPIDRRFKKFAYLLNQCWPGFKRFPKGPLNLDYPNMDHYLAAFSGTNLATSKRPWWPNPNLFTPFIYLLRNLCSTCLPSTPTGTLAFRRSTRPFRRWPRKRNSRPTRPTWPTTRERTDITMLSHVSLIPILFLKGL